MGKPLIVGYDPGTTTGLAIIDINKNILYLRSKKDFGKKEIIKEITKRGNAILVTGDTSPLQKSVEKLASSLGCKEFEPNEDLTNLEKYKLVKEFIGEIKNSHERDALAAAINAQKSYAALFKKADQVVSYTGLMEYYDKVLKILIKKEAESINDAINVVLQKIRQKKEDFVEKKSGEVKKGTPEELETLKRVIKLQENDIKILKKYNETLKSRLEKADGKYLQQKTLNEEMKSSIVYQYKEKMQKMREEIEKMSQVIEKHKVFRQLEQKGFYPIIEIDRIEPENIGILDKFFGLQGRIIKTNSFINVRELNKYKIKALIAPTIPDKEVIKVIEYPLIEKDQLKIRKESDVLVVEKEEIDEKIKKARKTEFLQWISLHKKRKF